jgi:putative transposase
VKFAFIVEHRSVFQVKIMCRVLAVSPSAYYAWRGRQPSRRERANAELARHIQQAHLDSRGTYGSPRIQPALRAQGIVCNHKRVERLMRVLHIQGLSRRRKRPTTTDSNHKLPVASNVLNRDFSARAPNQKWLGDITYIDTLEGFLYLASLEDVFSRRIVGWAMADHMQTSLVASALGMALFQRQPNGNLLHHTDRGSQYASHDYRRLLAKRGITVSMSRPANCFDNAMKESFFATLKTECAAQPFVSRAAARLAIFEFIEVWYNRQRLHSALGYLSPEQFERQYAMTIP